MNKDNANKLEKAFLDLQKSGLTDEQLNLFMEVMRQSYKCIHLLNTKLYDQTLMTQKLQNELIGIDFMLMPVSSEVQ